MTLAILQAQRRPDGLGRRSLAVDLPLPRQRERDARDRRPAAPRSAAPGASARTWRASPVPSSPTRASRPPWPSAAIPAIATLLGPVRPPCAVLCRTNAGLFEAAIRGRDRIHIVGRARAAGPARPGRLAALPGRAGAGGAEPGPLPQLGRAPGGGGGGARPGAALPGADHRPLRPRAAGPGGGPAPAGGAAPGARRSGCWRRRTRPRAWSGRGCGWPTDFPSLEELDAADRDGLPYLTPEERDQELHLLYVAATRARQQLEPNDAVRSCLAARAGPVAPHREDRAMLPETFSS